MAKAIRHSLNDKGVTCFVAAQTLVSIWNGAEDLILTGGDRVHSKELSTCVRGWHLKGDWTMDRQAGGWVGQCSIKTSVTEDPSQHIQAHAFADNGLQTIKTRQSLGMWPAIINSSVSLHEPARRPVQAVLHDNWGDRQESNVDARLGVRVASLRSSDRLNSTVDIGKHRDTPAKEAYCLVTNKDQAQPLDANNEIRVKHMQGPFERWSSHPEFDKHR